MQVTLLISRMLKTGFKPPAKLGDFMRRSPGGEPIFHTLGAEQKAYVHHYHEACYVELVTILESLGLVDESTHPDTVQACLRDLIKGEALNRKEAA